MLKKIALAIFLATMAALYFIGGGEKYFSVELYQQLFEKSPATTIAIFFMVFFIGISISLPVAGILTIISGIIFGTMIGFMTSLLAMTLGGTVALYSTRYLFRDLIKRRFSGQFEIVNRGIEKEGAFYLVSLRMIPVIPFGLLNLLVSLTAMKVSVFMLATLIGLMPILLILAYAGGELGHIESISVAAILTPGLISALVLLASFPFIARAVIGWLRHLRK